MFSSERPFSELAIPGRVLFCTGLIFSKMLLSACTFAGKSDSVPAFNDGHTGRGPVLLVVGDSLSSGVMASVPLGKTLPPQRATKFMKFVLGSDHSLEASQRLFSEYHHSATVTDAEWGIRATIAKAHQLTAYDIPVIRGFKWGARLMNAINFATEMEKNYPYPRKAGYIFVWIGGNDFCRDKTPEEFKYQYVELLVKLAGLHPEAVFFVALLPKVHSILKHTFTYSPALSCLKTRKAFCGPIFREGGEATISEYNSSIRTAVARTKEIRIKKELPVPVIHLITEIEDTIFEAADLCFDCFHPSIKGHRKFAKIFADRLEELLQNSAQHSMELP